MGNDGNRGIGRVQAGPDVGVVVELGAAILRVVVEPRAPPARRGSTHGRLSAVGRPTGGGLCCAREGT
jgi:hypothetical protein